MSDTPRIVTCPTCSKPVKWTQQNKNRPFCSDRCRLIDLGDWAGEKHSIPGDADHQDINSDDLQ